MPPAVYDTSVLDGKDTDANLATPNRLNDITCHVPGAATDLAMTEQEEHEMSQDNADLLNYFEDDPFNNIDWATGMDPWFGWNGGGEQTGSGNVFKNGDNLW